MKPAQNLAKRVPHSAPLLPQTDRALAKLRDRALDAVGVAFTISDPTQPDNPLVWLNSSFEQMTGYPPEEALGRNCRFLQGPDTDPKDVQQIRDAIQMRQPTTQSLLNYRKDGTTFTNEIAITPVFDDTGELISYAAVMVDVSERVRREAALLEAHAAERRARTEAETARRTQSLLAESSSLLTATLDTDEALDRLLRLVIPLLADWAVVTLFDETGRPRVAAVRHRDGHEDLLAGYARLQEENLTPNSNQGAVLAAGAPALVERFPDPDTYAQQTGIDPEMLAYAAKLGLGSAVVVPLKARRRILGTLALLVGPAAAPFDLAALDVAADLGRRAGLALDNARLYQREHSVAEALQRSLLPDLPSIPGLEIAARYVPGDGAAQVGGDFYEVLELPDGTIGLAIGDVVGHDMTAAAQMGHLRGLLRACAYDASGGGDSDPATVLSRVDRLVHGLHVAPLATLLYGHLTPPVRDGSAWTLTYATAGHPPALLRHHPDGRVQLLDGTTGHLLGVAPGLPRSTATLEITDGSLLLLYTDGLVERRDEDIDDSIHALVKQLDALSPAAAPEQVCERLTGDARTSPREDDIAVLAIRLAAGDLKP